MPRGRPLRIALYFRQPIRAGGFVSVGLAIESTVRGLVVQLGSGTKVRQARAQPIPKGGGPRENRTPDQRIRIRRSIQLSYGACSSPPSWTFDSVTTPIRIVSLDRCFAGDLHDLLSSLYAHRLSMIQLRNCREGPSSCNVQCSSFPYTVAGVVTKAANTSETSDPTQTPFGQPNCPRIGFLKGSESQTIPITEPRLLPAGNLSIR
jgi:hypothetical protein